MGIIVTALTAGLVSSLMLALPANASETDGTPPTSSATSTAAGHEQQLRVSAAATVRPVVRDDYVADSVAGVIATSGNVDSSTAAALAAQLKPGKRLTIVQTALDYLGDRYVLGGASHSGIDCSGLTLVAYASIGIKLRHLVSVQDAMGQHISKAQAAPGDLIVFDNDEHIGIYLGGGLLVHAPEVGRPVEIEPVASWSGVAHHFIRLL